MTSRTTGNKRLASLLALSVITLAVYLSALKAGFLAVDDTDIIRFIQSGKVSASGLFRPSVNAYYRPVAMLSLLGDFSIFGGNPAGYHLTNLLLHLANVLLVYWLATILMGSNGEKGIFPFLAALLFAVHPVNSEAVVWISARPDLLCCFFFLLCMVLLVKGSGKPGLPAAAGMFVTFFCSLASKEASLFLPLLAMAYFVPRRETIPIRNGLVACSALLLAALAYLLLRKGISLSPDPAPSAGTHPASHAISAVTDGAAALGFYIGKLIFPFPLNIAITEIPVTVCLGIFLLCIAAFVVLWKNEIILRFPIAFLSTSLIPPLGALFLSVAWTPYAERYLYLPSVAFSLFVAMLMRRYAGRIPETVLVGCALLAAIPTVFRVNLWTKPIAFWQDAVAKSPGFGTLRLPLAAEYIEAGRYAEAEAALRQAEKTGFPRESARDFSRQLEKMIAQRRSVLLPATINQPNEPGLSGAPGTQQHQTR